MSLKPVCFDCQCFYRPEKNGFRFTEGMLQGNSPGKGINATEGAWQPYKLWVGDLWKCPICGHQIIVGATNQQMEHFMSEFKKIHHELGFDQFQVNDC